MSGTETFQEVARLYALGARALVSGPSADDLVRGRSRSAPFADLAVQAEGLLPVSERLTMTAVADLATAPPEARGQRETALLAKVLADLEISDTLLRAAREEEFGTPSREPGEAERERSAPRGSRGAASQLEPALAVLLGVGEREARTTRTARAPATLEGARHQLKTDVGATLLLITSRATESGRVALEGLLGLGLGQVGRAAGIVGLDIAEALGQAEKVTKLYDAFRGFLYNAYNSIMALLGPEVARKAAEEVPRWLAKLDLGEQLDSLTARFYHVEKTRDGLAPLIDASQTLDVRFAETSRKVLALNEGFRKKTGLVDMILPKIRYVGMIPLGALPQGQLLMGAAYIALGAYVLFLAADYVDSTQIRFLDRVPGVRRVVETDLASSEGG